MSDAKIYKLVTRRLIEVFGDRVTAVVLFSPRARHEGGEDSDHDMFLVIEGLPDDLLERLKQVRVAVLDMSLRVNIIAIAPEQVAAYLTPLLLDIRVTGECLYGAELTLPHSLGQF